jgi:NADH:ubiquinone oxidoreductase subunit F (NADH-binding)
MLMVVGLYIKMTNQLLIKKIEESGLTGRGGGAFSVAKKWKLVKKNIDNSNFGYIIVNAAEGEPEVKKDGYLLENETELVIAGINRALLYLGTKNIKAIYFYLNVLYLQKYKAKIEKVLKNKEYKELAKKIIFYKKPQESGYIGGEESAIVNVIGGQKVRPSQRPPFPPEVGLFAKPTLINNVESFYNVALIAKGTYDNKRLFTLAGACSHKGVYNLSATMSIADILHATDNYPDFPFFVIAGGAVCGEVLDQDQLIAGVEGSGLIMIFNHQKTDYDKLLDFWLRFYENQSCGLCTPCREGSYRLRELFKEKKIKTEKFTDLLDNLEQSTFCALGSSLPYTVKSYLENIYFKYKKYE